MMDRPAFADEEAFVNKLILLYIFDQCNVGLIESVIYDIATSHNWIKPIFCKPGFDDLVKTDYLVNLSRPRAPQPRYKITPEGRECLKCFYYKIPLSVREEIAAYIKENIISFRKQQDYVSDYYRNEDGSYTVLLKIVDDTSTWMELKLKVDSRAKAKWIFKTWRDKAVEVYGFLSENVIEN